MNILIYGAGAVGLGLASCLIKSGAKVDLLARPDTVSALREQGLERTGIFGSFKAMPSRFNTCSSLENLADRCYDYILVCTKTYDTRSAAEDLGSHSFLNHPSTRIVLCQNGWGNAEIFTEFFSREQIKNARIITGFRRPLRNQVEVTVHADAIHMGSLFGGDGSELRLLCDAIHQGGIPCRAVDGIGKDLWAKMLYNCALNALGAIFDVPYGFLGESEHTRKLMEEIVAETYRVMHAAGYATHWTGPEDYLKTFYGRLLPSTYRHESSMLQDIRAQKKTEINALNGAVVETGTCHQVPVPYNQFACRMIQFMETRRSPGNGD